MRRIALSIAVLAAALVACGVREDNDVPAENEVIIVEDEAPAKNEICRPSAGKPCP